MLERRIESVFGWPLHLSTSPNKRTLYNFPMQGNGAEMLRLAAWRLCEAGIVPIMLVHDGILFELRQRGADRARHRDHARAGRDVCDGFEIGVDVDQLLERGARYRDKRPVAKADVGDDHARATDRRSGGEGDAALGYVMRHGKRIEVETLNTGVTPRKRRSERHSIGCPVEWLKHVLPIVGSKQELAIAIWLHRRRAVYGNELFAVPKSGALR